MTFEEAINKSIKAYFSGKLPKELTALTEGSKYTPEYFDALEKELLEGPQEPMEEEEIMEVPEDE